MLWNLHWWMVDDDWYNYHFKTGPFRCHFWLPKRAGPAILTEGGKFWYCLMISPANAKLTNAWIPNKPRHLCNDIMPYNAWQHSWKSTQGRVAPLTSLHQRSCTEGKWWKMWVHLDNSIRIRETHSKNLAMARFLFSHLSVQLKMLHIFIMPFGASTLSLSEAPASIFRNCARRSSCRHNITRRLRSVGIGLY